MHWESFRRNTLELLGDNGDATMNERMNYLCELVLEGRRLRVIWYSDDVDGFVRLANGKIASFSDPHQARVFGLEGGISLEPDAPVVYDLDNLAKWCAKPTLAALDPVKFLNVWNMLLDAHVGQSDLPSLFGRSDQTADKIYNKLFFANNLPSVTPDGTSYVPIWSEDELDLLSRTFRLGLAQLRANIGDVNG